MKTSAFLLLFGAAFLAAAGDPPPAGKGPLRPDMGGTDPKPPVFMCAAISPDGSLVATGHSYGGLGDKKRLRLWDAATGKEVWSVLGPKSAVRRLAFSPDRKYVLSRTSDSIQLWDAKDGAAVREFAEDGYSPECGALSGDGKLLLTTGTKHVLSKWSLECKLWDAESGKLIKTFDGPMTSAHAIHFAPGRKLALLECQPNTSDDSLLKVFDVEAGKTIRSFSQEKEPCSGIAAFSPDGKSLLLDKPEPAADGTPGGKPGPVLWDLENDKEARRFPGRGEGSANPRNPSSAHAYLMAFSPEGKTVLTADADGMLRLWDVAEGKLAWAVEADCEAAGFAAAGKEILLVRVTRGLDREQLYFQFRDAATGEQLRNR